LGIKVPGRTTAPAANRLYTPPFRAGDAKWSVLGKVSRLTAAVVVGTERICMHR